MVLKLDLHPVLLMWRTTCGDEVGDLFLSPFIPGGTVIEPLRLLEPIRALLYSKDRSAGRVE